MRIALKSLSADEQQQFEDLMNKMWEEAKEKFLSHFMVDRHQKFIKQGEIQLDSLRPLPHDSNVSISSVNQSIMHLMEL